MSLDVAYSYCINLTEEEKLKIDKEVRKSQSELKVAIFCLPFFWGVELPQLEPRVAVGPTIPGIQINENPKSEPARERTYDNYEKVELNNYHTLKNSSTIVITGSEDVLAFRKNIDQDPGIQDRKACFEQLMPRNTNKPGNSNELDALEGRGEVLLTKNNISC